MDSIFFYLNRTHYFTLIINFNHLANINEAQALKISSLFHFIGANVDTIYLTPSREIDWLKIYVKGEITLQHMLVSQFEYQIQHQFRKRISDKSMYPGLQIRFRPARRSHYDRQEKNPDLDQTIRKKRIRPEK